MPRVWILRYRERSRDMWTMGLNQADQIGLCTLYRGEDCNPFKPGDLTGDLWAMEFLKFQIWDAEQAFTENPQYWMDMIGSEDPEEAYKFCIQCKLRKMGFDRSHNWLEMYFNL